MRYTAEIVFTAIPRLALLVMVLVFMLAYAFLLQAFLTMPSYKVGSFIWDFSLLSLFAWALYRKHQR